MSGEILFLAHRLPFPPDRGDRIRSHHVLESLTKIAPVHVGCFVDSDADRVHVGELSKRAASYCVVKRGKPLALAGVEALLHSQPVSLTAFASNELSSWVNRLIASGRIGAIYVFSGQMGQFVPASWNRRLVVDLVDVDSAKFEAYAKDASQPKKWLHAREGRLLSQVEAALVQRADHTLLVSEAEADLLRGRVGNAGNIRAMGNGIDAGHFDPGLVVSEPAMAGEGPQLLFTGQMDYPPNVAAVQRMALHIMPRIRETYPMARFHVVGRTPAAEVLALDGKNGCVVHGQVADMRPWLAGADLVTVPLTIARGVQNKVLEAMAMARPLVLSEEAATGIEAVSGEHFQTASDDVQFAAETLALLGDRQRAEAMGQAARQFVIAKQGWEPMLADLPKLMGLDGSREASRDAA